MFAAVTEYLTDLQLRHVERSAPVSGARSRNIYAFIPRPRGRPFLRHAGARSGFPQSSDRSLQPGFIFTIRAIFLMRDQPLSCFSRAMARDAVV